MKPFQLIKSRLYLALGLLGATLIMGVVGFRIIAGYSWGDALYMTVITLSTVGFGEVNPLTPEARLFTVVLILFSVIALGFAVTVITEYLLSSNTYERLRKRELNKKIRHMENHVIICGFGRNGQQAAQKLKDYNKDFVVVEQDAEVIKRYAEDNILFLEGNANEDETLEQAGIAKASTLITALPDDADNLFVVLSARQLNHKLKIISRASVETSQHKLKLAGANNVIMPDRIGGDHMASLVVVPDLIEFLDNLAVGGEEDSINVEEIGFDFVCPDGKEATIKEIDMRYKTGCTIIGYKSPQGKYTVNPSAERVLESGSKLIVLGRPEQIRRLHETFGF